MFQGGWSGQSSVTINNFGLNSNLETPGYKSKCLHPH
jgi:hypothetical protein